MFISKLGRAYVFDACLNLQIDQLLCRVFRTIPMIVLGRDPNSNGPNLASIYIADKLQGAGSNRSGLGFSQHFGWVTSVAFLGTRSQHAGTHQANWPPGTDIPGFSPASLLREHPTRCHVLLVEVHPQVFVRLILGY